MLSFNRCTGQHADFRSLVTALDEELNECYDPPYVGVKESSCYQKN